MSQSNDLMLERSNKYIKQLCNDMSERYVGSEGNKEATRFFAEKLESFGFAVEMLRFPCFDWHDHGSRLSVKGQSFEVLTSPYSMGGQLEGELCTISNLE